MKHRRISSLLSATLPGHTEVSEISWIFASAMKDKRVCVYGRVDDGVYHGHADALVTGVEILTGFEGVGMEVQDARCPSGVVC